MEVLQSWQQPIKKKNLIYLMVYQKNGFLPGLAIGQSNIFDLNRSKKGLPPLSIPPA